MSFPDAVRSVLGQYATFTGRARRSEYWYFVLFTFIVGFVAGVIDAVIGTGDALGGNGIVGTLVSLALLLPGLAVGVRRMHDIDRSGWWILINLIPIIGWIIWIVFCCTDSKPDNRFGPNPKNAGVPGQWTTS